MLLASASCVRGLCGGVGLFVDAVRLVLDEVPRNRLQSTGLLRVVDLRGEASRSAVDVAAGLHVNVVLVVDEVPRRRLAKTISELRRLSYAFTLTGDFPDVAHSDGTFGFTEYECAVGTTQPNVPRTIKEARVTPVAVQWSAAAEREIASL